MISNKRFGQIYIHATTAMPKPNNIFEIFLTKPMCYAGKDKMKIEFIIVCLLQRY